MNKVVNVLNESEYNKYIPIGIFLFFIVIGLYGAIINYLRNEILGSFAFLIFGILFICLLPKVWKKEFEMRK